MKRDLMIKAQPLVGKVIDAQTAPQVYSVDELREAMAIPLDVVYGSSPCKGHSVQVAPQIGVDK